MMSLRKGWMDGRIGYKVLYILALECSQFLEKKLKNATWDGLSLSKKKVLTTKYFLDSLVLMANRPLFDHLFLNVPKNGHKIFKKWYLECF